MVRCSRCCLHNSMKMVNLLVNLFGVAIIVYSLWLLKRWDEGVRTISYVPNFPRPWFIYASLGEGIIVCLSMLSGHMVATCISPCTLFAVSFYKFLYNSLHASSYSLCYCNQVFLNLCFKYVASICSVLCVEATAFISIFYYIDWKDKFSIYIDEQDKNFGNFLRFNLTVSRFLLIITLVAQINAVIVAIILWAKGPEPRSHCCNFGIPEFKQSFLVLPDSPGLSSGGSSIGRDLEASK